MDEALLQEFRFDWTLAGKSPKTADTYILLLRGLMAAGATGSDIGLLTLSETHAVNVDYVRVHRAIHDGGREF